MWKKNKQVTHTQTQAKKKKNATLQEWRYKTYTHTHIHTCHKQNESIPFPQKQKLTHLLSDQLKAFKLALDNLLPLALFALSVPLAAPSLPLSLSLWQYTDVLRAAHPSCVAWSKCIDLSAKWYVVLLFPRDSDVLSPLRRSLCLTQLQWEIWGQATW